MHIIPKPRCIDIKDSKTTINDIKKNISSSLGAEEYELTIKNGVAVINAGSQRGVHYGEITLNQIINEYGSNTPELAIRDYPEYAYRGFMVDSCRHFFTVNEIKKIIDVADFLKLNYFHFHLSDDQGFRMEIDSWDRLTTIATKRNGSHFGKAENDNTPYQHYYTKQELKEIVAYCKERHIDIIPELDLPGHTSAILSAYPELSCKQKEVKVKEAQGIYKDILCAGNDDTYRMLHDVIDEMCDIFDGEYFHIGGDEAPKDNWKVCPKCQAKIKELGLKNEEELHCHMVNEINSYLKSKGKNAICWNEAGVGGKLDDDITLAFWMDKTSTIINWANSGNSVIVEKFNPYYSDYPYGMYPLKSVYKFDPRSLKGLTNKGKDAIIGVEAPIWTEYITTIDQLAYMCFPRWFAVSDTAWRGCKGKDYNEFKNDAMVYCKILNDMQINTAPTRDWDPNPISRLASTLKFTNNLMTRNMIKQLLGKDIE